MASERYRKLLDKKRIYLTPRDLLTKAVEYFEWCEDNPLLEEQAQVANKTGAVVRYETAKARAFTIRGFCEFAQITRAQFNRLREAEGWSDTMETIEDAIYTQKFEHAAAGLMNASFVGRDLGLADKQEHTGAGGGPVQVVIQGRDAEL